MDNDIVFKALSSSTRLKIINILLNEELHLSALARKLKLSVPVVSKHIKILEEAGLLDKKIIGNIHLLSTKINGLEEILQQFSDESTVEIKKQENLLNALKQIPGIESKKIGDKQYINSINGEEGYYIYEVDGEAPDVPINEYVPDKKVTVTLKKIVPINKKKININILKNKEK